MHMVIQFAGLFVCAPGETPGCEYLSSSMRSVSGLECLVTRAGDCSTLEHTLAHTYVTMVETSLAHSDDTELMNWLIYLFSLPRLSF